MSEDLWNGDSVLEDGVTIPDGVYHVKIAAPTGDMVTLWEDGRPRLQLGCIIQCGDKKGLYGPRIEVTLGASSGISKKTGKEFVIEEEETHKRVVRLARALLGDDFRPTTTEFGAAMLEEIGEAAVKKGAHFLVGVRTSDDGFLRVRRGKSATGKSYGGIYPVDDPPRAFSCECGVGGS